MDLTDISRIDDNSEDTSSAIHYNLFSPRLEALISAAIQDGILTDKEREILKRRVEKEGEDWDEVEMIIETRLLEIKQSKLEESTPTSINSTDKSIEETPISNQINYEPVIFNYRNHGETSIVVPEGVTEIPPKCFWLNNNLRDISMPSSLEIICEKAFDTLKYLRRVDLSKCKRLRIIDDYAFNKCENANFIFPENLEHLEKVGIKAFSGCNQLTTIDLSKSTNLIKISEEAFSLCSSLKTVQLCDSIETMEKWAFGTCIKLESISLPASLTELGYGVFVGCKKIKNIDFSKVTKLKILTEYTFAQCDSLEELELPNCIEVIENGAVGECPNFSKVNTPLSLKELGKYSIYPIPFLAEGLYLPPNFVKLDTLGCHDLDIYCFSPGLMELEPIVRDFDDEHESRLHVLPQYLKDYKNQRAREGISEKNLVIKTIPFKYLNYFNQNEEKTVDLEMNIDSINPMVELNNMIGLSSVKRDVSDLANFVRIQKMREERGLKTSSVSYHCVFTGNPGTGKTTVARIVSEIYKELGILQSGHLIETDRSGLVAEYVGQTAPKTNEVIDSALDGVLFIDEAYSLVQESKNDFGHEAIATLLKRMEDDRDRLVVILAGYSKEMEVFLNSNSGLQSRFNRYIEFPDYNISELMNIFNFIADKNGMKITNDALECVYDYITKAVENKDEKFGNARFVRNLFEKIITKQANRLVLENNITNEMLTMIEKNDVEDSI